MTKEWVYVLVAVAAASSGYWFRAKYRKLEREKFISKYVFSSELFGKLKEKYPHFGDKEIYLIARAMRQFFLVYSRANKKVVGMPSRVVDDLWHEFILDTKRYTEFCKKAFGRYFHHIPASKNAKPVGVAAGLMMTWRLACLEENINPNNATRLPLLFAIDEKLKIPGGNVYQAPSMRINNRKSADCSSSGCSGSACVGDTSCSGDSGCGGGCGGGD